MLKDILKKFKEEIRYTKYYKQILDLRKKGKDEFFSTVQNNHRQDILNSVKKLVEIKIKLSRLDFEGVYDKSYLAELASEQQNVSQYFDTLLESLHSKLENFYDNSIMENNASNDRLYFNSNIIPSPVMIK